MKRAVWFGWIVCIAAVLAGCAEEMKPAAGSSGESVLSGSADGRPGASRGSETASPSTGRQAETPNAAPVSGAVPDSASDRPSDDADGTTVAGDGTPASDSAASGGGRAAGEIPSGTGALAERSVSVTVPAAAAVSAHTYVPAAVPAASPPAAKPRFRIPVLNYHSIGIEPENNAVLDPKKLERQMEYLAKEGYTTLTIRQFIEIWDDKMKAPPKSVLLTFDDGYADNHATAMPILQKYGFHATMFLSPGMVGQTGYVDWKQARELLDAGWDIQPHGMTHPYLHKLPVEKQRYEIEEAVKLIKEHLGVESEVFCYPYGMYNKDTLKLLAENNIRFAFTIDQGKTDSTQNPLLLKRIFVGGSENFETFVRKLTKW